MTQRHEVSCRDGAGRSRSVIVFGAPHGRVGIQTPSGEVFVLTLSQLHELWAAAVAAYQPSGPADDETAT